jgi:molybdopterin-binding protein
MRSDAMKKGVTRSPHRALFKAMGYTDEEIQRPLIGVANSANEIIPGHIHLDKIVQAVKDGIRMAGGTPVEFSTIGVCDGIAMGHLGMKYSLGSRELIADSVEIMATAHPFDGLVVVPNCDKIVPGMLMGMLRLNIPALAISGGPMEAGFFKGKKVDLITSFEAVGQVAAGRPVLLCLRPEAVALWADDASSPEPAAAHSSIRNRLRGTIRHMTPQGPLMRVVIDCGFPVVALITRLSAQEMGLRPDLPVAACFKATAVHLIPR